jgi:hypothetical protein
MKSKKQTNVHCLLQFSTGTMQAAACIKGMQAIV